MTENDGGWNDSPGSPARAAREAPISIMDSMAARAIHK